MLSHRIHQFVRKLILGLRHSLSDRQFFIVSSVLVGLSSGLVAVLLKAVVHEIATLVGAYSAGNNYFWFFALLPLAGIILATVYATKILKEEIPKGSSEIQYNIAKKSSLLSRSQMYSHAVTSSVTVGFGGSMGLESPMVSTGAAIGSNYARAYTMSYRDRTVLLACGAAAGIAAAFNAPIAGVLFAIEVVLTDISLTAFIPLIIAAASGALVSKMILREGLVMSFALRQPFNYANVPMYVLLGVLAGMISLYYVRTFQRTHRWVSGYRNMWARAVIGGLLLALIMVFFPPLFGEGYQTVSVLANATPELLTTHSIIGHWMRGPWLLLGFLVGAMLLKSFAAGLTLGGGGNGGNFAPSLFVGAYLGFAFARLVNLTGLLVIPETNFALVGMAGVLSGVFYAPLTAIFLIAEVTGGYELMIPLMIVSALSLAIARYFEPLSMEAKKLAEKLNHSIENRDQFLLSKLELSKLIETDFLPVKADDTLQSLVMVISRSHRNTFPVVNDDNELVGLVHLDHVRATIFQRELYESVRVKDLMVVPAAVISPNENLDAVLRKFDQAHQWNLPVVEDKKYAGFVSKSSILSKYREELMNNM